MVSPGSAISFITVGILPFLLPQQVHWSHQVSSIPSKVRAGAKGRDLFIILLLCSVQDSESVVMTGKRRALFPCWILSVSHRRWMDMGSKSSANVSTP